VQAVQPSAAQCSTGREAQAVELRQCSIGREAQALERRQCSPGSERGEGTRQRVQWAGGEGVSDGRGRAWGEGVLGG